MNNDVHDRPKTDASALYSTYMTSLDSRFGRGTVSSKLGWLQKDRVLKTRVAALRT